jgi:cyclin B
MTSEASKISAASRRSELKGPAVEFWNGDRPTKRIMLGAGSRQTTWPRSSAEYSAQARAESQLTVHPATALPSQVLGDVTNIASSCVPRKKSKEPVAEIIKPPATPITDCVAESELEAILDVHDPQQVAEYAQDIFKLLREEELALLPQAAYMDKQPHVNAKMRAILVDWLLDVAYKYKLKAETLFLAVSLVDRYLDLRVTQRKHLQLVGVTALLLSAKFEEISPPQVQDFVYVTDNAYTREEVMRMEVEMLSVLNFQLCQPTAFHFLQWFQKSSAPGEPHSYLAQYVLELALVDYKMIRYPPSHMAASAVLLSNKLLRRQPAWTQMAVKHTDLTENSLRGCVKEMRGLLSDAENSYLQAVRKKFSHPQFGEVAKQQFLQEVHQSCSPLHTCSAPGGQRRPFC